MNIKTKDQSRNEADFYLFLIFKLIKNMIFYNSRVVF